MRPTNGVISADKNFLPVNVSFEARFFFFYKKGIDSIQNYNPVKLHL